MKTATRNLPEKMNTRKFGFGSQVIPITRYTLPAVSYPSHCDGCRPARARLPSADEGRWVAQAARDGDASATADEGCRCGGWSGLATRARRPTRGSGAVWLERRGSACRSAARRILGPGRRLARASGRVMGSSCCWWSRAWWRLGIELGSRGRGGRCRWMGLQAAGVRRMRMNECWASVRRFVGC